MGSEMADAGETLLILSIKPIAISLPEFQGYYFCIMNSETGKWVIIIGIVVLVAGLIIYFFHDKLHWIGHLPGDLRVEKENFRVYFPLTTMIIFSVLVTLLVNIIKRLLH